MLEPLQATVAPGWPSSAWLLPQRALQPRAAHVTRQIVEALQGEIRVESEPSRGATFTVELPRTPA